jgi:diguanylate cyclase (GGDEF)-like protein
MKLQLSVIYAEDDSFTRELYAEMLRPLTTDLRLACDGTAALQLYLERPCDLLLTDLMMPGMDGLQLCAELRTCNPDLPVVVVSSHDQGDLLLNSVNLGIDGYLIKPVSAELLQRTLTRVSERLVARRQLEESARTWKYTFDAIPDLIAILDSSYRVVNLNLTAQEKLQIQISDALGRDYCTLLHENGGIADECQLHRAQGSGSCLKVCHDAVAMLGGFYKVSLTPVCNDSNQVSGLVHVARDITEKTVAERALRHFSTHDQLTGVYNRCWFETELDRLRNGRTWPISVIVSDLDGLKEVNDREGHAAGDELICAAARLMSRCFRADELIARVGGDEFVILLPGLGHTEAATMLERIRKQLQQQSGSPLVSMSLGVATADGPEQLPAAIARADQQMYRDKGRNKHSEDSHV